MISLIRLKSVPPFSTNGSLIFCNNKKADHISDRLKLRQVVSGREETQYIIIILNFLIKTRCWTLTFIARLEKKAPAAMKQRNIPNPNDMWF